jgi:hypothetical protein
VGKLGSYDRVSVAGLKGKKKERQQWGETAERGKGL